MNAVQTVLLFPEKRRWAKRIRGKVDGPKPDGSKVQTKILARCLANFSIARKTAWRTRKAAFWFGAKSVWRERAAFRLFGKGRSGHKRAKPVPRLCPGGKCGIMKQRYAYAAWAQPPSRDAAGTRHPCGEHGRNRAEGTDAKPARRVMIGARSGENIDA